MHDRGILPRPMGCEGRHLWTQGRLSRSHFAYATREGKIRVGVAGRRCSAGRGEQFMLEQRCDWSVLDLNTLQVVLILSK